MVAIVEMKAAVFEMAAAAAQHTDRIVNVELRLVPAGGDASPLQLRPAAGGGGGGGLAWVGGVAVFVATAAKLCVCPNLNFGELPNSSKMVSLTDPASPATNACAPAAKAGA